MRKKPTTTPGRNKRGKKPVVDPVPDAPVDSEEHEGDLQVIDELDPFAELFQDAGENDVVILRRTQPVTMTNPSTGESVTIAGYLEDLHPGRASYFSYVKEKYGGGTYYIQRRNGNRFLALKSVQVSGPPRCPELSAPGGALPVGQVDDIEGVNMSGDDRQWESSMRRLIATKKLLDSDGPGQINAQLLELLISQRQQNPLDLITQIGSVVSAVKDVLPQESRSGGTTLLDLGAELFSTVKELAAKRAGGERPSAPPRVSASLALPVESPGDAETSENKDSKAMVMDQRQIAQIAIQQVIAGFSLSPPKEPDRVVTTLDNALRLDKDGRAKLDPYRAVLFDLAEMELVESFEAQPEKRAEFTTYFNSIFESYINPEREMLLL